MLFTWEGGGEHQCAAGTLTPTPQKKLCWLLKVLRGGCFAHSQPSYPSTLCHISTILLQAQFQGSFSADRVNWHISSILGTTAVRIQICPRSKKWRLHQDCLPLKQCYEGTSKFKENSHVETHFWKNHQRHLKSTWHGSTTEITYITLPDCLINICFI